MRSDFSAYHPLMWCTIRYVKNYNQALARKSELMKDNKFASFMRDGAKHPDLSGETFEALLILPIQRVPRYELLLKDLIKHTWADHPYVIYSV